MAPSSKHTPSEDNTMGEVAQPGFDVHLAMVGEDCPPPPTVEVAHS